MKNTFSLLALCLIMIIVGVSWGIYEYAAAHHLTVVEVETIIKKYFAPPPPRVVKPPAPVKPPTPPVPSRPVTPTPPAPVVVRPVPPLPPPQMTAEEACQMIDQAEEDYKRLRFLDASANLTLVLKAHLSPELTERAVELNKKCLTFNEVIQSIPKDEMKDLNGMVSIQYTSGQTIVARLLEEKRDHIKVKRQILEKTISIKEIHRYTKLSPEDYQNILMENYQKRVNRLHNPTAEDYYQLALECYKDHLYPQALAMLELVWAKDKDLLEPTTAANNNQDNGLNPNNNSPLLLPIPTAEVGQKRAEADKYYNEGKEHLEKTFDKGPDFDKENEEALKCYRKAMELYRGIQAARPDDDSLDARIEEIGNALIYIHKQTRLKH